MIDIQHLFKFILLSAIMALTACSNTPPAPVINRLPSNGTDSSTTIKSSDARPAYKTGDWRPNTYTVKKGDTLYGIGLEFGYDYKEIAEFNQISPPYPIKIGQLLKFKPHNSAPALSPNEANEDGVTTVPFNDESPVLEKKVESEPSTSTSAIIQSPKANRIPYSDEAFNKAAPVIPKVSLPKPASPVPVNPIDDKPVAKASTEPTTDNVTKPDNATKYETAESVDWSWPHEGKVSAWFNESTNKGLDISGKLGQAINAAASGKVIYSGSDLRGYGKLVIIKHNPLYLSVYAHNSLILVKEGQLVNRGQKIAEMGNSESSSVKLHFEIRRQGKSVDPKLYLPAN